jgi:hypothetical protein
MSDGIDDLMAKLDEFAVSYTLTVTPCDDGPLRTVNVTRLGSICGFAAALSQAGWDAAYSAGTGWHFNRRVGTPDNEGSRG